MQIGLNLPTISNRTNREILGTVIDVAEELGYHSVWAADHIVMPREIRSAYPFSPTGEFSVPQPSLVLEPLNTLAWAAGRTKRIKLGTGVLVLPYRHPLLTAKMAATLDYLSNGRVILGVGSGWMEEEFDLLGSDYQHRGTVTDEHIAIYRAAWTQDNPTFQGKHFQVSNVWMEPKPVQKPSIPIWVGSAGPAGIRRAARLGDGWAPSYLTLEELERGMRTIADLRAQAGRTGTFEVSIGAPQVIFASEPQPSSRPPMHGTPDQMIEDLVAWRALGVTHVRLRIDVSERPEDVAATMRRLMRDVVDQLPKG